MADTLYRCGECGRDFKTLEEIKFAPQSEQNVQKTISYLNSTLTDGADGQHGRWPTNAVKLLISLYKEHENKFSDICWPSKKVWSLISKTLQENNYLVTGSQCDEKWRNLKKSYRKIKDGNKQTGQGRRQWEFFSMMDEILGQQPYIKPSATFESSSSTLQVLSMVENNSGNIGIEPSSSTLSPLPKLPQKHKRKPEWFEDYKKLKEKSREERRRRHAELLELRRKQHEDKMEFRKELLGVLKSLVEK
ncbi:trihelix transcription factor GTL1-like [Centruroides sculpturatus]|uniref:trihelix transcription factor GTL1-like n=1 Tax=Centruroides sculpturatus TaxID=218467 RepID=UPI000C6CDA68|nr:trihelix transcription factor GTL1-like [Centruroides sculpturatus]